MLGNLFTLKTGETYGIEQGVEAIQKAIKRSYSIKIYDPPPNILVEVAPYLGSKKVSIQLPQDCDISEGLLPNVKRVKNRIKATYHGHTMYVGSISTSRVIFDLIWDENEIYDISAITVTKCLTCSKRSNIRAHDNHDGLLLGSILPTADSIMEIERHLRQSDWAFFSNIPPHMVSRLVSALHNKDVKLILPHGAKITPDLVHMRRHTRVFPHIVKAHSKIYGRQVQCGGICLPHIHFGIGWDKDEIISVRSFEWLKCVECMHNTHQMGWHFCKRM